MIRQPLLLPYAFMEKTIRKRRGLGRSTIFDVAQVARTSAISVSRYFNSPELVSTETRERIRAAIAQTGYIRNQAAGGLASTQGRIVSAIVPSVSNSIFAETIQGLANTLATHDYQLLLATHNYSLENEEKIVKAMIGWSPRALVLTGVTHSPATEILLAGLTMPVIETWDLQDGRPYTQVGFSHIDAGAQMTTHLLSKGYRKIVFVDSSNTDDFRAMQRAEGYRMAMEAAGARATIVRPRDVEPLEAGRQILLEQLQKRIRPDALFFCNDNMAAGAIYEAARARICIPEQCAIAGFGDFAFAAQLMPSLTTIRVPRYEIGRRAADNILQQLGEIAPFVNSAPLIDRLEFQIVSRDSA